MCNPGPPSLPSSAPAVPLMGDSVPGAQVSFCPLSSRDFLPLLTLVPGHVDLMNLPNSNSPSLTTLPSLFQEESTAFSSLCPRIYSKPSIVVITLLYNCLLKEPAIMDEHNCSRACCSSIFQAGVRFLFFCLFVFE